jgi:hypothetical protein
MLKTTDRTFYHITQRRNVPSITNEGLIPKTQQNHDGPKAVYFWGSLKRALAMVCPGDVIIQASIPEGWQIYRMRNEAAFLPDTELYEYFVHRKIPSDRLKVVHSEPSLLGSE